MTTRQARRTVEWGLASLLLAACGGEPAQAPSSEPPPAPASAGAAPQPVTAAGTAASAATSGMPAGTPAVTGSPGAMPRAGSGGISGAGASAAGGGGVTASAGAMAPSMAGAAGMPSQPAAKTIPTVYWLDINSNRVMRSQNFEEGEVIVSRTGTAPDGVALDVAGGKLYWTNMGSLLGTGGGTLQRANLDGSMVEQIVMPGVARTPKQMQLDPVHKQIYWGDREGAKIWRANLDGTNATAIVSEHGLRECVGIALDIPNGKFYFTDRLGRKILRANVEMPAGETGATRKDLEEVFVLTGSATPIDLDIDHGKQMLYWTDRTLGTVHRANLEIPAGQTAATRMDNETLVRGLTEPIGMSLDVPNGKMYFTELGGRVSEAALDGSGQRVLFRSASASGVVIANIPQ